MPNWCNNYLRITGTDEDVEDLLLRGEGSLPTQYGDKPSALLMQKFLPQPEELEGTSDIKDSIADQILNEIEHGAVDWMEWRENTWGTKWDLEATILNKEPGLVEIDFQSAWGPPLEFLQNISTLYPRLEFVLEYDEPNMELKGKARAKAGEMHNEDNSDSKLGGVSMREYSLKDVIAEAIAEAESIPKALPPSPVEEFFPQLIDSAYALNEIKDTLLDSLSGMDIDTSRVKPALMFAYNKLKRVPSTVVAPSIPYDIIRLLQKYNGLPDELIDENSDVQSDLLINVDGYVKEITKIVQHVAKVAFRDFMVGDKAYMRFANGFPTRVPPKTIVTVTDLMPNFAKVTWGEGDSIRFSKVETKALQLMDFKGTTPLDMMADFTKPRRSPKDESISIDDVNTDYIF